MTREAVRKKATGFFRLQRRCPEGGARKEVVRANASMKEEKVKKSKARMTQKHKREQCNECHHLTL